MKKILALVLTLVLCSFTLIACGSNDDKTITVAASAAPHAEILEKCIPLLEEKGYKLEVKIMDDYITPNTSTDSGDVDANYFQHIPYLNDFNAENDTKLVVAAKVHYEPYALYCGTSKSLDEIGDGAVIAVPNDATNEARALLLLEANGFITLKEGVGLTATKKDIVSNPKNLDIREMEAALLPGVLDEVNAAVINGNYALGANLSFDKTLFSEDSNSEATTYTNVLVVNEGNEKLEKIQALVDVLTSDTIRAYITETYGGAVVPVF